MQTSLGHLLQRQGPEGLSKRSRPAAATRPPGTEVSPRQMKALLAGQSNPGGPLAVGSFASTAAGMREAKGHPRGVLRLVEVYGTEYIGPLGVGTRRGPNGDLVPETVLSVIYDTGSADLWVASDLCKSGPCTYPSRRRFNHSRSETFHLGGEPVEFTTAYISGELQGTLGVDDVRMGPLTVQNQALGLIQVERGDTFEQLPMEGIVGLGFAALAAAESTTPLFDNLVQQGSLPKQEFAFYLHSDRSQGGAVLWGGVDERLFEGPLIRFPVVEEGYWALDLVAFRVGKRRFEVAPPIDGAGPGPTRRGVPFRPLLIVDSGTTYSTVPSRVWGAISRVALPMQCAEVGRLPPLVYELRDSKAMVREISVPPREYMVRGGPFASLCVPGVVPIDLPSSDRPLMILGEVFMRYHFTVFSRAADHGGRAEVGIARAVHGVDAQAFFEDSTAGTEAHTDQ